MNFVLEAGGTDISAGLVSMSVNDEIIWSSDTGRTLSGWMIGDVIAEKKNISLKYSWLTENQVKTLKQALRAGFFNITFRDCAENMTIPAYRSTLTKESAGYIGDGIFYYRSVSVDVIQR